MGGGGGDRAIFKNAIEGRSMDLLTGGKNKATPRRGRGCGRKKGGSGSFPGEKYFKASKIKRWNTKKRGKRKEKKEGGVKKRFNE